MTLPADVVREAAKEDSRAAVETWGPAAFARRLRRKIHNFGAPLPPWEDKRARPTPSAKGIPKSINIILLGPTGSGKSSLVYTWWRALSGSVAGKEEFLTANAHNSFLERLRVGWTTRNGQDNHRPSNSAQGKQHSEGQRISAGSKSTNLKSGEAWSDNPGAQHLSTTPRHGTTSLNAFELQAPDPNRGSAGITVHDTKGQQFFTEQEERFAEQMLQGKVKEGSTLDNRNFRYWFMLGSFGFFSTASLAKCPHAVVLVFDVTLRSFQQMLRERGSSELCQCYRKIVRRSWKQGQEVFAVLTHIDAYQPDDDTDEEDTDGEERKGSETSAEKSGFDGGVDMPGIISLWRKELSAALSLEGQDERIVPTTNVFAVQNYHQGSSAQDPVLDLASLECLESVIEAGKRYVDTRYQQQQEGCTIA